jgi:hypothetical protein
MKKGQRVEMVSMTDDPDPVPTGTKGTVQLVDAGGTVHVRWDNGRNLGMIPGQDRWRVIHD